jgi:hypothetical protein
MMVYGDYLREVGFAAHELGLTWDNVSDALTEGSRHWALPLAEQSLTSSGVLPQPVRRVEEPEQLLPHLEGQTLSSPHFAAA